MLRRRASRFAAGVSPTRDLLKVKAFADAEALVVFAALVASRVVASNDTADGKASAFASAVVAPTWIVRWCRGDRGTRHYWIFVLSCVTTFLVLLSVDAFNTPR